MLSPATWQGAGAPVGSYALCNDLLATVVASYRLVEG